MAEFWIVEFVENAERGWLTNVQTRVAAGATSLGMVLWRIVCTPVLGEWQRPASLAGFDTGSRVVATRDLKLTLP